MFHIITRTPRLILRHIDPVLDAQAMFDLNADPLIMQNTGDAPFESVAATQKFFEGYTDYEKYGFGRWAVVLRETNEVMGWCGLKQNPDFIDLGYRLIGKYRGNGYATEAAKASLDYGFEHLGMTEIIAKAKKENTASLNVMKKIGMPYWKQELYNGYATTFYKSKSPT